MPSVSRCPRNGRHSIKLLQHGLCVGSEFWARKTPSPAASLLSLSLIHICDAGALDDAGAPVRADGGHLEAFRIPAELIGNLVGRRSSAFSRGVGGDVYKRQDVIMPLILPAVLPFNLIKTVLNSALTLLVYLSLIHI